MNTREKNPAVVIAQTGQPQARQAARMLYQAASAGCRQRGLGCLALSGGSTPQALFAELAREPLAASFPWHRTHFFWVDERMVPYEHPHSNYGTARRILFDRLPEPVPNLHPMPSDGDPKDAAERYEQLLRSFFRKHGSGRPIFDAVLLGLGADGHTASLFPGAGRGSERWVQAVQGGDPPVIRLTLTEMVLNHARAVIFLVSGRRKAGIVQRILEGGDQNLPAARIRPPRGSTTWLLDRQSASLWHAKGTPAVE